MQATAYTYDPESRSGQVLLDDGTPVPFDAAAFDAGASGCCGPGSGCASRPRRRVRARVRAGTRARGAGSRW